MAEDENTYALHEAIREGRFLVAEKLLKDNEKLALRKDSDGRLPIHWAASANSLPIITLLAQVRGFEPDVQDEIGWTPLMIAVNVSESDPVVNLLLAKGANINIKNNLGQTIMHHIASKKNLDLARKLLDLKPPVTIRVKDKRGQYPIHRAAASGSGPMVELLLKACSPVDISDSSGSTPLHHAIAEGHGNVAIILLKAGADVTKKDGDGYLPLELSPDKKVRKYIERQVEREGLNF